MTLGNKGYTLLKDKNKHPKAYFDYISTGKAFIKAVTVPY